MCIRDSYKVEERMQELAAWADEADINVLEDNHAEIGVIASGAVYQLSLIHISRGSIWRFPPLK